MGIKLMLIFVCCQTVQAVQPFPPSSCLRLSWGENKDYYLEFRNDVASNSYTQADGARVLDTTKSFRRFSIFFTYNTDTKQIYCWSLNGSPRGPYCFDWSELDPASTINLSPCKDKNDEDLRTQQWTIASAGTGKFYIKFSQSLESYISFYNENQANRFKLADGFSAATFYYTDYNSCST